MNFEPGKVRAPEVGRVWFNSSPLNLRMLRGRVPLIDFFDYTCVNCLRTLPYLSAWHERYADKGLVIVGVHTPEFTFAQYESNVARAIVDLGIKYPVVLDSNYELWRAFANRYWPAKYLIDKDGYIRYMRFGEGAYEETERAIQQLLQEAQPQMYLPPVLAPLRPEDLPGAVCQRPTTELYLGHQRGRIGNPGGYDEDRLADYSFKGEMEEGIFYARGHWAATAEYMEVAAPGESSIALKYSAAAVNLVMAPAREVIGPIAVLVRQDDAPLRLEVATGDTRFRPTTASMDETFVTVDRPRMYFLVNNHEFATHMLELVCHTPGVRLFAFTFTTCVEPGAAPDARPSPAA